MTDTKKLTLQIDKASFKAILNGRQTIEHRYIYPNNASRYVTQEETPDGIIVDPIYYDTLYLINGRRKDAPRLLVEVLDARFVIDTDADGNDLTFVENGEEYLVCEVWYHLGRVLQHSNADDLLETPEERAKIDAETRSKGFLRRWEDDVKD